MIENLPLLLPELYLAGMTLILLLVGVFRGDRFSFGVFFLAEGTLLVAGLLTVLMPHNGVLLNGMVVVDGFARYAKILILAGSFLSLLLAPSYLERTRLLRPEFPILVLFATLGMMLMVGANDFLALYAGLELQSLSLYILASFRRDSSFSAESGLKYFVLGSVASCFLLYGISLLYGYAGGTGFDAVAAALSKGPTPIAALAGAVMILCAFAFKVSAAPFHMWTPDVYEGAPTPVAAFFAAAPKVAAFALLARLVAEPLTPFAADWKILLAVLSGASMILGSLAGLRQTNVTRLLAYSAILNSGFVLAGLAAGGEIGFQSVLVYLAIYLFGVLGAFGVVLALRRKGRAALRLSDMAGLGQTHPFLAAAMAIFLFSLTGIPPLAGFFGKYFVLLAAVRQGLIVLAVLGLVASVVAAFYYLRMVKIIYFDANEAGPLDPVPEYTLRAVVGLCALVVLFLIFDPSAAIDPALEAARSLIAR